MLKRQTKNSFFFQCCSNEMLSSDELNWRQERKKVGSNGNSIQMSICQWESPKHVSNFVVTHKALIRIALFEQNDGDISSISTLSSFVGFWNEEENEARREREREIKMKFVEYISLKIQYSKYILSFTEYTSRHDIMRRHTRRMHPGTEFNLTTNIIRSRTLPNEIKYQENIKGESRKNDKCFYFAWISIILLLKFMYYNTRRVSSSLCLPMETEKKEREKTRTTNCLTYTFRVA